MSCPTLTSVKYSVVSAPAPSPTTATFSSSTTPKVGDDTRKNRPWFSRENRQRVLDLLDKVKPIAEGHNATLAQVAINWVISRPGVTSALVGARTDKQVEENAKAADFRLTDEEVQTIRNLVEELGDPV